MVAEGRNVVACGIHHVDSFEALADADMCRALAEVACVSDDDIGALCLVIGCESGHVGIAHK